MVVSRRSGKEKRKKLLSFEEIERIAKGQALIERQRELDNIKEYHDYLGEIYLDAIEKRRDHITILIRAAFNIANHREIRVHKVFAVPSLDRDIIEYKVFVENTSNEYELPSNVNAVVGRFVLDEGFYFHRLPVYRDDDGNITYRFFDTVAELVENSKRIF